jgi:hypothetical protein
MDEPWLRALSDVEQEFQDQAADIRHMLITVDYSVVFFYSALAEVSAVARDQGCTVWPCPPDSYWRQPSASSAPAPLITQRPEGLWAGEDVQHADMFYGFGGDAYFELERLSSLALDGLHGVPAETYRDLFGRLGLPTVLPPRGHADPARAWMAIVHGVAKGRAPGSPTSKRVCLRAFHVCGFGPGLDEAIRSGRVIEDIFGASILLEKNAFIASAKTLSAIIAAARNESGRGSSVLNDRLDAGEPTQGGPPPRSAVEANGRPASSGTRTPRNGAEPRLLGILHALSNEGEWGLTHVKIADRAGISRSTLSRLIGQKAIKNVMREYEQRTLGKGPSRPDDY